MSEIPQDIRRVAVSTLEECFWKPEDDICHPDKAREKAENAIAKAIWAERQRNAKIADDRESSYGDQYEQGWNSACFQISQAILNQTE